MNCSLTGAEPANLARLPLPCLIRFNATPTRFKPSLPGYSARRLAPAVRKNYPRGPTSPRDIPMRRLVTGSDGPDAADGASRCSPPRFLSDDNSTDCTQV